MPNAGSLPPLGRDEAGHLLNGMLGAVSALGQAAFCRTLVEKHFTRQGRLQKHIPPRGETHPQNHAEMLEMPPRPLNLRWTMEKSVAIVKSLSLLLLFLLSFSVVSP